MAGPAYDRGFPVAPDRRHLPLDLLNRERMETIPSP